MSPLCSDLRAPSDPKAMSGNEKDFPSKILTGDCVTEIRNEKLTRKSHAKEELTFWRFSFLFDENLS